MTPSYDYDHVLRQVKGVILGHAIGDALGVPVESQSREALRKRPVKDYCEYGTHNVPAGTWSDDTSMNLAALDRLSECLDYRDMMDKFCQWMRKAAYTATDDGVFDIGNTTRFALTRYASGVDLFDCGVPLESNNGNGSLMRIIPAVLFCKFKLPSASADEHIHIINTVSALTHAHPRSQVACGIYYFLLMKLLDKPDKDAVSEGLKAAEQFFLHSSEYEMYARLFSPSFGELPEAEIKSSGYVVDTLEAAVWCVLQSNSYRGCVLKAVNLGGDTDTLAAVAGGLAGALYGMEGISQEWIAGLQRVELIEGICQRFCDSVVRKEPPVFDIHSLVLFDMDDGAKTMWEALLMIRLANLQGVQDIIFTSHAGDNMAKYWEQYFALCSEIRRLGIPVKLHQVAKYAAVPPICPL